MVPVGEPIFTAIPGPGVPTPPPLLTVTAPWQARAGSFFAVQAPNGEHLSVQVPPDVQAGATFQVIVPAHVLCAPPSITDVPMGMPVNSSQPANKLPRAQLPTPLEMQRIGDAHRSAIANGAELSQRPPPLKAHMCACIGDMETSGRWELPHILTTYGCITDLKLDLRDQRFAPGERTFTVRYCALIHSGKLIIPPEINMQGSGCALIPSLKIKDKRPKELRGHRVQPTGVVNVEGCALIADIDATMLEHGQPTPKCIIQ